MKKEELIEKLENERSLVEFYKYKEEILSHLGGKKDSKRKKELMKLSMEELREIGDPLGAKDNSKEELIDEIIDKEGL